MFKRRILSLFFVLVLFCLFSPLYYARAGWVQDIISGVGALLIAFAFLVIGQIAILFSDFAGWLLKWVISTNFIRLSYTNPAENPIIEAGLNITQGFVNMLLVLILIYIAMATILRLAGHETKKLLVTFIVVALLVNFAPVICGLIVDASNIVMNFFVSELAGLDTFTGNMSKISLSSSYGYFNSWEQFNTPARSWTQLFLVIGVAAFNFGLGFALLLFAAIFVLRYIMIWLLVILSPLAFACYILPQTKKYFDKWWEQFLSWSFIGVTCGFFLYLGFHLVNIAPEKILPPATGAGSIFNAILPYGVAIAFLVVGLIFGLQTSAAGASTIISNMKRGQKTSAKWLGGKIAQRGIRPALEKMRTKEAVGKISRGIEKIPVARWFLPEAVRKYGQMRPAIEKGQERAKAFSSQTLSHRILKGADIETDAAGALKEMIERGEEEDLYKEARKLKKWKGKNDQQILADKDFQKIMGRSLQIGARGGILSSKFLRGAPRLARLAAGKKWAGDYKDMTEEEAVQEATRQARRPNINQMERETFEDKIVVETMMEKGREVPEAVVAQVKKGQETMHDTIDKLFSEYIDNVLSKTNAALAAKIKSGDKAAMETGWDEDFRKYFNKKHQNREGYFKYAEGQRAKEMGWRKGLYKTLEQRKEGPAPTTPFGAGMGPTPSPPDTGKARARGTSSKPPPDIGEARKTKRKEPDTGKK